MTRLSRAAYTTAHPVMRFITDSHAKSAISYSILIALVVVGVAAAAACLGTVNERAFAAIARLTGTNRPGTPTTQPVATSSTTAIAQADSAAQEPLALLAIALLALGSAAALATYLWHKRRAMATAPDSVPNATPDTESIPSTLQARIFAKRQIIYQILDSNEQLLAENRVEVRHVMTKSLITVPPDTPMTDVSARMKELRVRHLLVCQDSKLVGVISDRDLKRSGTRAADVMSHNPETVTPSTPVARAITLLMTRGFSCLPVLDGDHIVGLLTTTDLMMTLQCTLRLMEQISLQIRRDTVVQDASAEPVAAERAA